MVDKIYWIIVRRIFLRLRNHGFAAHWKTYACKRSHFGKYVSLHAGTSVRNVTIGDYSYVAGARINDADVGMYCSIGPEALIGGLGTHPIDRVSTHPTFYSATPPIKKSYFTDDSVQENYRTTIGHDVWIGARVLILDNITIGSGAIIAAGSVVIRNVEPYTIVAGVPAKTIRKRFSPDKILEILDDPWWFWSEDKINSNKDYFMQKYSKAKHD